jgi:hypothetical protein
MPPADLNTLALELEATPPEAFLRWDGPVPAYAPILDRWSAAVSERGYGEPSPFYNHLLSREAPPLNRENIASADAEMLIGYATFILRGEHLCYGHIGECHTQGLLAAVTRRFAELESA